VLRGQPPGARGVGDQPLDERALRDQVITGSGLWTGLSVVASTGSTNEDLLAAARSGAPAGTVLVAEEQTRGRGRLDRSWHSVPGAALTFSVLLRPAQVPPPWRGWLPLLAGVAVASAVRGQAAVDASLKWPNDVLSGGAKLAGILAEQAGDAVVVGFGINVSAKADELPSGQATSLLLRGAANTNRQALLAAVLGSFEHWYRLWTGGPVPGDAESSGLRARYLADCVTIGAGIRVELPGGTGLAGRGQDVDGIGRLIVATETGLVPVSAGDVIHVR
jgi:BirA family transcriptional regulator, biotin operon repressor / biotin---[acetyl-CoA-carboxylase] ligase